MFSSRKYHRSHNKVIDIPNFMNGLFLNSCNRDFIHRLNEMEKKFKKDCQLEIERSEMVARLRQYLEKVSIFTNIEFIVNISYYRMRPYLKIFWIKLEMILINACKKIHRYRFHKQYSIEFQVIYSSCKYVFSMKNLLSNVFNETELLVYMIKLIVCDVSNFTITTTLINQ